MFGLGDIWVSFAFGLSVVSVIICVIYGLVNWNKGHDDEMQQIKEEITWQVEDVKIDENF